MMSQPGKKTIGIYILSNMSPSKDNHAMKLCQLIEYNKEIFFFKNEEGRLIPDLFLFFGKLNMSLLNCVPCMLKTCSRVNVPCVLTCSRAYVPCVLICSRVNVPCVLTYSRTNVSSVLTYSHANVPCVLTCLRVNVPCMRTCSCLNVPSSITLIHI